MHIHRARHARKCHRDYVAPSTGFLFVLSLTFILLTVLSIESEAADIFIAMFYICSIVSAVAFVVVWLVRNIATIIYLIFVCLLIWFIASRIGKIL